MWLNTVHNIVNQNKYQKIITSKIVYGLSCVIIWHVISGSVRHRQPIQRRLWIICCPWAHINHKGNRVEKYNQWLNKIQTISGQYCVSYDVLIQKSKTSKYAWNSSPIDDTDVMHSVVAVGIELIFPLNTELLPKPPLNPENNQELSK